MLLNFVKKLDCVGIV